MGSRIWKLDIGCGKRKQEGYLGLDWTPTADHDVRADLGHALPFAESTFDEVWMSHVFEHLEYPVHVLDEIWRVAKPNARVEIRGPHFSSPHLVWGDPTHRRGLSLATFLCFTPESNWYVARSRYRITSVHLVKGDTSFREKRWRIWYWPLLLWNKVMEAIINISPASIARYERLLARFLGFQELRVVLSAVKTTGTPAGA